MKWIDMHCDTISELLHGEQGQSLAQNKLCVDMGGLKKAETWIQYFACFVNAGKYADEQKILLKQSWEAAWKEVLCLLERLHQEANGNLQMFHSCRDVEFSKGSIYAFATVEEGGVLNGNLKRLESLYQRDVRLLTLTWNYENCIGYPNSRRETVMRKGLKPFGVEVIRRMNDMGMLIDVSHLSDGGFWDCIRESKAPVVASHSNARALCAHPRNLSDEMLRALAEKGGVSGLNFYPAFLCKDGQVTTEIIARHAKYMMEIAGEDIVAVGTDFDGFQLENQERYISHVSEMEGVWESCKKAGITERQLDKICWKNVWRVMQEVIK